MSDLFPGFARRRVAVAGIEINCRLGGKGRPVLLLHGYPETHACWHRLAPALAESFNLVIPDLPGYGDSGYLEPDPANRQYSKRQSAVAMAELMRNLGHARFAVVGHDRGARVAYRLALDRPDVLTRLALFDILPTIETWEQMTGTSVLAEFHWPFLAQPGGLPEALIDRDPDFFLRYLMTRWAGDVARIHSQALAEYLRCFRRPPTIRATCADYRAGATADIADDEADRQAGRRISCPLLLLWAGRDRDLLGIWRRWASDIRGEGLACGHFLQEEAPSEVAARLLPFLQEEAVNAKVSVS
jgi:haloacetate dehalogenase